MSFGSAFSDRMKRLLDLPPASTSSVISCSSQNVKKPYPPEKIIKVSSRQEKEEQKEEKKKTSIPALPVSPVVTQRTWQDAWKLCAPRQLSQWSSVGSNAGGVKEMKQWFEQGLSQRTSPHCHRRWLLVQGPLGCGKKTLIKLMVQEMNLQLNSAACVLELVSVRWTALPVGASLVSFLAPALAHSSLKSTNSRLPIYLIHNYDQFPVFGAPDRQEGSENTPMGRRTNEKQQVKLLSKQLDQVPGPPLGWVIFVTTHPSHLAWLRNDCQVPQVRMFSPYLPDLVRLSQKLCLIYRSWHPSTIELTHQHVHQVALQSGSDLHQIPLLTHLACQNRDVAPSSFQLARLWLFGQPLNSSNSSSSSFVSSSSSSFRGGIRGRGKLVVTKPPPQRITLNFDQSVRLLERHDDAVKWQLIDILWENWLSLPFISSSPSPTLDSLSETMDWWSACHEQRDQLLLPWLMLNSPRSLVTDELPLSFSHQLSSFRRLASSSHESSSFEYHLDLPVSLSRQLASQNSETVEQK